MICPNCKLHIDNNLKYCNYCGEKISNKSTDNNHEDQFSYSQLYSNINQQKISSDEDYINAFMGKKKEKITNDRISIPTLFFGPIYLLYRKMINLSLVLLAIIGIVGYYNLNMGMLLHIIICIYLSFTFHTTYQNFTEKKIDEIKISNPDKSSTELLEECRKKGGTTAISSIITVIILAIVLSVNILIEENQGKTNSIYKGKVQTTNKIEKLNYHIPKNYYIEKSSSEKHHFYRNDTNNCSFRIELDNYMKLYKNTEDFIKRNTYIRADETISPATKRTINGINWIQIMVDSSFNNRYILGTNYNNTYYAINFYTYNTESCTKHMEELIQSLKFER